MPKLAWLAALLLLLPACGNSGGGSGDDDDDTTTPTPTPTGTPDPNWEVLPALSVERQEHPVLAFQDEIWMIGGFIDLAPNTTITATIEAFDPVSNSWRADIAPLPTALHHANVAIANGTVYVTGSLLGGAFTASGRVFEYDPVMDQWNEKTAMPLGTERGGSAIAAIGDYIYVAGGYRSGSVADFSRYDTVNDMWEPLTDVPVARDHAFGAAVGGKFYLIGGRQGTLNSSAVYEWDPAMSQWTQKMNMPTARGGIAGAVSGNVVYILGGENLAAGGVYSENEAYDAVANTWESKPPMANPRHGMGAAAIGNKIYVPGGGITDGFGATDYFDAFLISN